MAEALNALSLKVLRLDSHLSRYYGHGTLWMKWGSAWQMGGPSGLPAPAMSALYSAEEEWAAFFVGDGGGQEPALDEGVEISGSPFDHGPPLPLGAGWVIYTAEVGHQVIAIIAGNGAPPQMLVEYAWADILATDREALEQTRGGDEPQFKTPPASRLEASRETIRASLEVVHGLQVEALSGERLFLDGLADDLKRLDDLLLQGLDKPTATAERELRWLLHRLRRVVSRIHELASPSANYVSLAFALESILSRFVG